MPSRRFWKTVTIAVGLGALFAAPVVALILFHEGPWSGFAWDLMFRFPFVLMCAGFAALIVRAAREGKWKDVLQGILVLALFGTITFLVTLMFARQLQGLMHFHRMQVGRVRSVTVECHTTNDPAQVAEIISALRQAEWYSPDAHGWAPYAAMTLRFTDGQIETYMLTEVLAEGRLIIHPAPGNSGLLAIPRLSWSLERAGLLRVGSYPRYDNKGLYKAIVPTSICKEAAGDRKDAKAQLGAANRAR